MARPSFTIRFDEEADGYFIVTVEGQRITPILIESTPTLNSALDYLRALAEALWINEPCTAEPPA